MESFHPKKTEENTVDPSPHVLEKAFYRTNPAVYGLLTDRCVLSDDSLASSFRSVHYEFIEYPDDCICGSHGVYIAKEELIAELLAMRASGVAFDRVEVTLAEDLCKNSDCATSVPPKYRWLRIYGRAGVDDLSIVDDELHGALVVSSRILSAMLECGLNNSRYSPYNQDLHVSPTVASVTPVL